MRGFIISVVAVVSLASGQAPSVTRFEQDDARIAYSGTWYPNTNAQSSAGSSILANLKGSQAVVTFKGTGIAWIGTSDPFSGYAYVYLDGVPSQVDTANGTSTLYQQTLFSAHNLAAGLHTLTIEITHSHDEVSDQSWIWVDAFDIDNGTLVSGGAIASAGLVEQTNAAVTYGGHWFQTTNAQQSGGSVNSAVDAGAWVNLAFNGTGVTWIGYRDEWSGIAQVYVDGTLQASVDTYLTPSQAQAQIYAVKGLSSGTHNLKIVGTGTQDSSSGGPWIWVDAFNVVDSGAALAVGSGAMVSAATYAPAASNPVAPGQIVSIFGSGFLSSGRADATALPLPTQLSNVSVTACNVNVPLYTVVPGQINAQLPFECPTSGATQFTVTANGQSTAAQSVTLAAASPGVFTTNAAGTGDAVALHGDGTLVSATNPAIAGEQIVIYCTGLGLTTPSFPTGSAATSANKLVNAVKVSIGGQNANVIYSGLTVGLAGLYQINVAIPAGLSGSQPLIVASGSAASPAGVNVSLR